MFRRLPVLPGALACALALCLAVPVHAVTNPDLSVIGQPSMRWTDDAGDPAAKRWTLDPGEVELVFDAPLNPYATGRFILALTDEGMELEEGYFLLTRGLPGGLALRGGKYRAEFGKLNVQHPHQLPFAERFRVLAAYLPGEEAFNETGVQLSARYGLAHDMALTLSADWLQGDSFRRERASSGAANDPLELDPDGDPDRGSEPRPAGLARASLFAPIGERNALEVGLSATQGTSHVAAGARTTVVGADAKAKLWRGENAYLLLQGEVLKLDREEAGWDETAAAYTKSTVDPAGGYVFADWNWDRRWNLGASYERWQTPDDAKTWDQAFGVFGGLALMEETTAFRLGWEYAKPGRPDGATEDPDAVQTVSLRVIFSMGPHKAHQF